MRNSQKSKSQCALIILTLFTGRKMFAEQRRDGERVRIIVNEEDYSYDEPVSYE